MYLDDCILNLAVQGRLTIRDPNDEPAFKLLKRIAKEKNLLERSGAIRRPKQAPRDETKLVGNLPHSWLPIALGDACTVVTSGCRGWGEFYAASGPGFIRAQNIRFGYLKLDDLAFVNPPPNSEGGRT